MGANKIKGMYTCDVCGRDFPLIAEERYTVRGAEKSGLATAISFEEADRYDAFDCPHCGCQNVANLRLRELGPEGGDECPDGCEDCFTCGHEECGCYEGERTSEEGGSDGE